MKAPAAKRPAWKKLLDLLSQPVHDYRPTTDTFLDVNVDRVADDLHLVAQGTERGANERPTPGAQTLDDTEHKVVERLEAHKQSAQAIYLDHLHTYDQRLAALNFEERFATIQQAVPEAMGDFAAEAALGRDELFSLRRHLFDCEQERDSFRAKHKIARPARVASTGKILLKAGLLAILFVIEVVVNGSFLAKSSLEGVLGGTTQAVGFAALNIIASFMFGLFVIRLVNRRNFFLKFLGLIGVVAYLSFAIGINLVLAHLREMPPTIDGNVGEQVLARLLTAPHSLTDVNSWVFFGIGFLFSIIAMIDGLLFTDPYFGYASLQKRVDEAHEQYTNRKAELIEQLREIRDEVAKVMNEATRDLSVRRGEFESILQGRSRLAQRFAEHQNHIERSCNALLTIYREANRKARHEPAPDYFSKPYVMERIPPAGQAPTAPTKEIEETQALLKQQIQAIHNAFNTAAQSYREIDDLIPENRIGPATAKAA
jgi:hypothetical protein